MSLYSRKTNITNKTQQNWYTLNADKESPFSVWDLFVPTSMSGTISEAPGDVPARNRYITSRYAW